MISLVAALLMSASPPPAVRARPAPELGSLASLISTEDYPPLALRNEEQGIVAVRLDVGRDGAVSACTITGSSGSASLDSATCRVLQLRARFTPARDAKGRAVPDTFTQRIAWLIEPAAPAPPDEADLPPPADDPSNL